MKFGVREICDVVLKAKAAQKVGNKVFYKNEPVIYFDTLKTSSMEGAALVWLLGKVSVLLPSLWKTL